MPRQVDQLHVALMSQREAIPDVDRLAGYVAEAVEQLDADRAGTARNTRGSKRRRIAIR